MAILGLFICGSILLPFGSAAADAPPLGVYMDTLPDGNRRFPPDRAIEHFERLTGKPVALFETFTQRNNWDDIERPGVMERTSAWLRANPDKNLILSVPAFPESEPYGAPGLAKCARGEFNAHYEAFARNARDLWGVDRMLIRFGWEWNGDWYPWGTGDDEAAALDFAQCYRHFVESVDRAFPDNRFVYVHDIYSKHRETAWPGDDVVDVVAIDIYDDYWGGEPCRSDPQCRWDDGVGKVLKDISRFARAKNKPLAIPEWGVWNKDGDRRGGGDNPYYIQKMCEFIADPANNVAFTSYFEDNGGGDHFLYHPKNSQALAAFREHCEAAPTADLGFGLADGVGG